MLKAIFFDLDGTLLLMDYDDFCSMYFDIFDGLIQAYVFVFLTALFIKEATETD